MTSQYKLSRIYLYLSAKHCQSQSDITRLSKYLLETVYPKIIESNKDLASIEYMFRIFDVRSVSTVNLCVLFGVKALHNSSCFYSTKFLDFLGSLVEEDNSIIYTNEDFIYLNGIPIFNGCWLEVDPLDRTLNNNNVSNVLPMETHIQTKKESNIETIIDSPIIQKVTEYDETNDLSLTQIDSSLEEVQEYSKYIFSTENSGADVLISKSCRSAQLSENHIIKNSFVKGMNKLEHFKVIRRNGEHFNIYTFEIRINNVKRRAEEETMDCTNTTQFLLGINNKDSLINITSPLYNGDEITVVCFYHEILFNYHLLAFHSTSGKLIGTLSLLENIDQNNIYLYANIGYNVTNITYMGDGQKKSVYETRILDQVKNQYEVLIESYHITQKPTDDYENTTTSDLVASLEDLRGRVRYLLGNTNNVEPIIQEPNSRVTDLLANTSNDQVIKEEPNSRVMNLLGNTSNDQVIKNEPVHVIETSSFTTKAIQTHRQTKHRSIGITCHPPKKHEGLDTSCQTDYFEQRNLLPTSTLPPIEPTIEAPQNDKLLETNRSKETIHNTFNKPDLNNLVIKKRRSLVSPVTSIDQPFIAPTTVINTDSDDNVIDSFFNMIDNIFESPPDIEEAYQVSRSRIPRPKTDKKMFIKSRPHKIHRLGTSSVSSLDSINK